MRIKKRKEMVAYNGGKQRHGKAIKHIILQIESLLGYHNLDFFDAFAGMCGVSRQFSKTGDRRVVLNDLNPNVVALLKKVQKPNWGTNFPPQQCLRSEYDTLKSSSTVSARKGFIGIACSFNGNYFRGFRSKNPKLHRDFVQEFTDGLRKLSTDIRSAHIMEAASYDMYSPEHMIVYCDSPYIGNNIATPYFSGFDFVHFWNVMRKWSKSNLLFISEREAPNDFVCIWKSTTRKKNMYSNLAMDEKLFVHESLFYKLGNKFPEC